MLQNIKLKPIAKPVFYLILILSLYVLFKPGAGPPLFAHADKVVHITIFALLAGSWRWAFGWSFSIIWWLLAYAITSEIIQHFLPTRSASWLDLVADAIGILIIVIATKPRTDRNNAIVG